MRNKLVKRVCVKIQGLFRIYNIKYVMGTELDEQQV